MVNKGKIADFIVLLESVESTHSVQDIEKENRQLYFFFVTINIIILGS